MEQATWKKTASVMDLSVHVFKKATRLAAKGCRSSTNPAAGALWRHVFHMDGFLLATIEVPIFALLIENAGRLVYRNEKTWKEHNAAITFLVLAIDKEGSFAFFELLWDWKQERLTHVASAQHIKIRFSAFVFIFCPLKILFLLKDHNYRC